LTDFQLLCNSLLRLVQDLSYTLLVNHLFVEIAKHEQFQEWQAKGFVPQQPTEKLIEAFTANRPDQLPSRFCTSAVLMTRYVYKAWFKLQKNRRLRLQGKKHWVETIERDDELVQTTNFSREEVCSKAQEILHLANRQGVNSPSKRNRKQPKAGSTLLGFLLNHFDATAPLIEQRAIIHLLKNDLAVGEQDKAPEVLAQQLESKKIEIERLEKQLQSQLPKGRDPPGERYFESLLAAIALPDTDTTDQEEANLSSLKEQKQIELFNSLPYPIIFGSADDLIWSRKTRSSTLEQVEPNVEQEPTKAKQPRRKKKPKFPSEQLCVRFKGLRHSIFKIQCDRRQLSTFRQFLTDYQFHYQAPKKERFSQALFVLKTAQLIWRPNTQNHHRKSDSTSQSQSSESKPWQTHRLYLHCNIGTQLLTAEGTEETRQQVRQETLKTLKGRELLSEEELQELELTANQRSHIKRLQSTLSRLENPSPDRPSIIRYQGNPLITVGVSLNSQTPLTACVIDLQTGSILECQNTKQLLTVRNIKVKRGKQSILQLKLADWRLVNKLHVRRQRNLLKQPKQYQQGQYQETDSESNLGLYVERLLASRLTLLAIKWNASSIAVPDLKHIRERLESDIQARARRKHPMEKELQDKYAKRFRTSIHRWSYSRLVKCIRDRAAKEGTQVITGEQPIQADPKQRARRVGMSAHAIQVS
ncbi:MAG: type V CRISPR-associated protein Cas12k, partial [Phormidesmis sp. CAN_BIN44]|nr:type V CRISPR-associated protein Cas12k [Phormidesmis sp. CAN_BIN44]